MSQRSPSSIGRSAQAVWVCFAIALLTELASGSPTSYHHHLTKRFFNDQCKGVYDQRIFAKLERICEDCYQLFHEPSIHQMCKEDCFTTPVFKECVKLLMKLDEWETLEKMIEYMGK